MQGGMGLVVAKFSTFQVHTIPLQNVQICWSMSLI